MPQRIPREDSAESTLALRADPYGFIAKRCHLHGSDVFEARILLRPTLCMLGRDAAELFYDPARFARGGAAPTRLQKTLFGQGGVQGLDGEAHRRRKAMFLSLMRPERVCALGEIADDTWRAYADKWRAMERVVLYDELHPLLSEAVCAWAGIPLPHAEVADRARDLAAMFDHAGAIGWKHRASRRARRRAERWIAGLVGDIRARRLQPPEESAAAVIASHRDAGGELLPPSVAAVELLNVLRPTVAVSVFIVFAALALHRHPPYRKRIAAGDAGFERCFAQEVRRFYPFFPALVARVREDFEWKGYGFTAGRRALFDVYGTNHDPRLWEDPEEFRPERFRDRAPDPFGFVPQGGGDARAGHRCPGEAIAVELIERALRFLTGGLRYDVARQDLRIDFTRLPALPRSRLVLRNVAPR